MSLMTFLKKPGVKLILGALGLIGTNVLTARATIKFIKEREAVGRETTLKEDIQIGMKCYGGAVAAGAASVAFLFAGNKGYLDNQDNLINNYNMLSNKYNSYRNTVMRTIGSEKVKEIEQKLLPVKDIRSSIAKPVSEGCILLMDPFSDPKDPVFVETTVKQMDDANEQFRRLIIVNNNYEEFISINIWRELQGFEGYNKKELDNSENYGYSQEYLENINGHTYLDITPIVKHDKRGEEYYYPEFRFEPCYRKSQQKHFL